MTTSSTVRSEWSRERRFYLGVTVAMLATVGVGFARSFFLRPLFPDWPSPPESIFYVHGVAFAAWVGLLVVQTSLVTAGRTDLHRKVGSLGVLLAASMVVLGTYGALVAARRPTGFVGVPVPPLRFLIVPLFDIILFAAFVTLAVTWRRDGQAHKRLMLLASINLLTAAIARWPGVATVGPLLYFALTDLFIVSMVVWDRRSRGRVHPATRWGGAAIVLSQPTRLVLSSTTAWMMAARWGVGLLE